MINIAVIGFSYWGPNLVRIFQESENTRVVACCDMVPELLMQLRANGPSIDTFSKVEDILKKCSD